jgi:hypothetical protein
MALFTGGDGVEPPHVVVFPAALITGRAPSFV